MEFDDEPTERIDHIELFEITDDGSWWPPEWLWDYWPRRVPLRWEWGKIGGAMLRGEIGLIVTLLVVYWLWSFMQELAVNRIAGALGLGLFAVGMGYQVCWADPAQDADEEEDE